MAETQHISDRQAYRLTRKVTLLGAFVNILLAFTKLSVAYIGHSHALFADGIHSLADLITDAFVLLAARFGAQAADSDHPYGHGRIETAATLFLAIVLGSVAVGIIWDAFVNLSYRPDHMPANMVLYVAVFSVLANEALYHITQIIADRIDSDLLRTHAWHHRSDALSSLVVLFGIAGVKFFAAPHLDAYAAIIVAILILKMALQLAWNSLKELIDTAVERELLEDIYQASKQVPGVRALHQLRTRMMSGKVFVDVHVLVESKISVSEGHYISHRVQQHLCDHFHIIRDVTVHIDHEDDEDFESNDNLPDRDQIILSINDACSHLTASQHIQEIIIHYLQGQLHLDIVLPLGSCKDQAEADTLQREFIQALQSNTNIECVRLQFVV